MRRLPILLVLAAGIIVSSCSKKSPEFVNSIPDDVIAVVSLHPMQLHTKSQINSFESIKERVKDEIWGQIIENPMSSGLMLNEYSYVFFKMEEDAPVIGVVAGMKDVEKFKTTLGKINENISDEFKEMEGYTYILPDEEGVIAWNEKQMVVLTSPHNDQFGESYWTGSLDKMFNPIKEESVTSLVDFRDFQGKMKDLNFWITSDKLIDVVKKFAGDKIPDIPITLYNNYAQAYIDFADGVMNVTGETHFSEEVKKNIEEFLVMNPSLNEEMLKLAPGGDLLLALAGSMDLEKVQSMVEKFAPPQLDEMGNKIESAIGIPADELLNSFTGDFTIALNGIEGEAMIPLELFLGLGVNGEAIQEKIMETVQSMVPVEDQGDFFIINIQGTEIYSGIIDNMWVVTNAKGYKDDVKDGSYKKSLVDSRFNDFADGSVGVYLNLDMDSYPGIVQGILEQNPQAKKWVVQITDPLDYLGISAGNYRNSGVLKTNYPSENSLYTILKVVDSSVSE